ILGVRRGDSAPIYVALQVVSDPKQSTEQRLRYIEILGEVKQPRSRPLLLKLISNQVDRSLHKAALTALQQFDEPGIASQVLAEFYSLDPDAHTAALSLLSSRRVVVATAPGCRCRTPSGFDHDAGCGAKDENLPGSPPGAITAQELSARAPAYHRRNAAANPPVRLHDPRRGRRSVRGQKAF